VVVDLASRPGVPERLIVGNERAFLTWLYDGATARPEAIEPEAVEKYLRSFSGRAGVLGSMGIYSAAALSNYVPISARPELPVESGPDATDIQRRTDAINSSNLQASNNIAPQE
jgi:hypothetical protein